MTFYKLARIQSMYDEMRVKTAGGVFSPQPSVNDVTPTKTPVELLNQTSGLPASPCKTRKKNKKIQ